MRLSVDAGDVLEDPTMYRCIVGTLIYMTIMRPDLSYVIGLVSQFIQTPRKPHLDVVRWIIRYINSTLDYGLFFQASREIQVTRYTNANWASSILDRRSYSGFLFSFGSATVSWSSKKQPIITLSSMEAEYRGAATIAACEVAWMQKLLVDMGKPFERTIAIFCDNMSNNMSSI